MNRIDVFVLYLHLINQSMRFTIVIIQITICVSFNNIIDHNILYYTIYGRMECPMTIQTFF